MTAHPSRLRQRLGRQLRAVERLVRALTALGPLTPGSFYYLRRKCGKAACRCARGQLHGAWVLTRSEAGRHKLYVVPAAQRARVRQLAAAWRRYQRARAQLRRQLTALLALADQLAEAQRVAWPP